MSEEVTPHSATEERPDPQMSPGNTGTMRSNAGQPDIRDTPLDGPPTPSGPDAQGIFDERFRLFTDQFGQTCERQNVSTALAVVDDPVTHKQIVYVRGNTYDIALIVAQLLRQLTRQILNSITP